MQKCISYGVDKLKLCGMGGAAMDYAVHGHAVAHVPLGQTEIECVVSQRQGDSLILRLPYGRHPRLTQKRRTVYVHFEINHIYFEGLHKAIDYIRQDAIRKLLPNKSDLTQCTTGKHLSHKEAAAIKSFTLDSEYQINALQRMISSDPRVPFLVLGPYGTGKTHILKAAVSALLCNPHNKILVCTHQHQCANGIYETLFEKHPNDIIRLVPNENAISHIQESKHGGVVLMKNPRYCNIIFRKRVVITTFLTATNLCQLDTMGRPLTFSHILIDEGAQTREPEALGALSVVKQETKIVIVGDNKQVCILILVEHTNNMCTRVYWFYIYRMVPGWLCLVS